MNIQIKISAILLLLTCAFSSCNHDDEDIIRSIPVYELNVGEMFPADEIISIELETAKRENFIPIEGYVHTSYASFGLRADIKKMTTYLYSDQFQDYPWSTKEGIYTLEKEYWNEKTKFIQEVFNDKVNDPLFWPHLFTAYIDNGVTITCDKKLFNKEPGENLSQYFHAEGSANCLPIGREDPYLLFSFNEDISRSMTVYFRKDAWLQRCYFFYFSEEPQEKYEELTFTLTVPVVRELITESMANRYLGKGDTIITSNDVYTGTCTVHFDFSESK